MKKSITLSTIAAIDFGVAGAKYIDAFFANVNWEELNRRLERAMSAAKLPRA